MDWLSKIFKFYINSSIHVSLAILSFVFITSHKTNISVPIELYLFVFFASITGYNFVKYAKIAGLHHHSLTESLRLIQIFSFVCFAILIGTIFFISLNTLLAATVLGILTLFYAVPILNKKNLRSLPGLKVVVVSIVWAGVTVLLPIIEVNQPLDMVVWSLFLQRFLIVFTLTLPFEIRDMKYDVLYLKTIPQKLGINRTKIFGVLLLVFALAIEIFWIYERKCDLWIQLVICLLVAWFLIKSKENQTKYYASFWVEGIPIVGVALYFLFCHFP